MIRYWPLFLVFFSLGALADEVRYFTTPYDDFSAFLELGDTETRVYHGKTIAGASCNVSVTKTADAIVITSSNIPGAPAAGTVPSSDVRARAFVVRKQSGERTNGGTSGNDLWSSYFFDSPGGHPHGQFGTSYRLELSKGAAGEIAKLEFSIVRVQDLGHRTLVQLQCTDLKQ